MQPSDHFSLILSQIELRLKTLDPHFLQGAPSNQIKLQMKAQRERSYVNGKIMKLHVQNGAIQTSLRM